MSTQRPFSKLKKQIENLFDPALDMEFCCSAYPMRAKTGYAQNSITRFYVRLGKDIIWDYQKDFAVKDIDYGLWSRDNGISDLVREYIDTPVAELLDKDFEGENKAYSLFNYMTEKHSEVSVSYGLTDLFKAADRRLGKRKAVAWSGRVRNFVAYKVLARRLYPEEFGT